MRWTVDDLCLKWLNNFYLFDQIKKEYSNFKLIAFTISNYELKEDLKHNDKFKKWFNERKDWVEIAVHSYDHMYPPDGDRDNEKELIKQARDNLKEYLPKKYGYRSAGWQTTNKTLSILKKLGFNWIAYENKINYFNQKRIEEGVINSHLYDKTSILKLYEILQNNTKAK